MLEVKQINFLPLTSELHVSPAGDDTTNNGSAEKPYKTLEKARDEASFGTLIYVHPGVYTVTTTDLNGLAKAGVGYYFYAGAIITKATSGDIFNNTGLLNDCVILGYGRFFKTTTEGVIWRANNNSSSVIIEALAMQSSVSACIVIESCEQFDIKIEEMQCSSSLGLYLDAVLITGEVNEESELKINRILNFIPSGSGIKIYDLITANSIKVNVLQILSSNSSIIAESVFDINSTIEFNIPYIEKYELFALNRCKINGSCQNLDLDLIGSFEFIGTITTLGEIIDGVNVELTGNFEQLDLNGLGNYNINGNVNYLIVSLGTQKIRCDNVNLFYVDTLGEVYINKLNSYFDPIAVNYLNNGNVIVNAGTLINQIQIANGSMYYYGSFFVGNNSRTGECITLNGGTLYITGRVKNFNSGDPIYDTIVWNAGVLVLDKAILICDKTNYPIRCNIAGGTSIIILTGGVCNNLSTGAPSFLDARIQKEKYTVNAVAITSITVDDGTNPPAAFSESDLITYDTEVKLAERLKDLINAAGLNVIASHTLGNNFFELEATSAGNPFTSSTLINLTSLLEVFNSSLMTPSPADGANFIIQDVNVI